MSKVLSIARVLGVLSLLLVTTGCINEQQTISGEVVDESGSAISNASVTACYSDWGWSNNQLVWDKDFCSAPVFTDNTGLYVIEFRGPDFLRLRARKEGWIQTKDFSSTEPRIVLTSSEAHSARQAAESMRREKHFRKRLPDESATDYYCRVILNRTRPVKLQYRGETVSVIPCLLKMDDHNAGLLALQGNSQKTRALANELQLRINRQPVGSKFIANPTEATCEPDTFFIETELSKTALAADQPLELLIPSIAAMFDVKVWDQNGL